MIDCMVFNAVFHVISVISLRPVYLYMLFWCSFNQHSEQYSHITIVETTDSGEKGIESCRNDYHQSSERILAEPGNRTSDLMFSSPVRYGQSYGARQKEREKEMKQKKGWGVGWYNKPPALSYMTAHLITINFYILNENKNCK